jgi:hypothetical protein
VDAKKCMGRSWKYGSKHIWISELELGILGNTS